MLYVSASAPLPRAAASTAVLMKPVPREAIVPIAMTVLDRARLGVVGVVTARRAVPRATAGLVDGDSRGCGGLFGLRITGTPSRPPSQRSSRPPHRRPWSSTRTEPVRRTDADSHRASTVALRRQSDRPWWRRPRRILRAGPSALAR